MKKLQIILAILVIATVTPVLAQTVVFEYDMGLLPIEQGFYENNSGENPWSLNEGVLQFRGEEPGHGYAQYYNLFDSETTSVQLDVRMRVLEYLGHAFDFAITTGSAGYYYHLQADDLGDDAYHDVTFYVDFVSNSASVYVDGVELEAPNTFSWTSTNGFTMGDGSTSGTWGNVDISSLTITVDNNGPVSNEDMTFGQVKSMFR